MAATIRTTIDSGGRVVIPKPMREELGLRPGERVDVVVDGLGIRITPVEPEVELVREGRILVAVHKNADGAQLTTEMVQDLIDQLYEERESRFW